MKSTYDFNKALIQNCKPSFSYTGENFDAWQTEAKQKLADLIGLEKFQKCDPLLEVEYEEKVEGATKIRFTFQSEVGYRIPCYILLPDGVEKPPVMVCMQGHAKGMHLSMAEIKFSEDEEDIKGDRDYCVRAAKEGFAAVAVELRNFGELSCNDYHPQCFESAMTALLMGRTTVAERVWDFGRLLDVLEAHFADRMDVNTVCCLGNSGGGTAVAYIAALEERVKLAVPSCAMCTYRDSIGAMNHCACNYVPGIAQYFDMGDLMAMAYPKYFVQVNGAEDTIFPLEGAKEVFAAGKRIYEEKGNAHRCAHVIGREGHRFYANQAWNVIHQMLNQ